MKLALASFLILVVALSSQVVAQNHKQIVGEWKYEVPAAPPEYQKGSLIISEKENNLTGKIKFSENYQIDMRDLKFENNQLSFALYVEDAYVKITATLNDKKELDGKAMTPDGEMKIKAKKV